MTNAPSIAADLIRELAPTITNSVELFELVRQAHPTVTVQEVIAELRRQADDNFTEADQLEAYAARRKAAGQTR